MKKITIFLIIFIIFIPLCIYAENIDLENFNNEDLFSKDILDTENKISLSNEGYSEVNEILPSINLSQMVKEMTKGEFNLDFKGILNSFLNIFIGEIRGQLKIMATFLTICILLSFITNLQTAFEKKGITDITNFAAFALMAGIAAESFYLASQIGERAIRDMSVFSQGILPTMAFLLISSGAPLTAGALQPIVYFAAQMVTIVISNLLMPLCYISLALSICSNITDAIKVKGLLKLAQKSIKWILAFSMAIFVAVLTVTNFATSGLDTVAGKALKFGVSSLIPVVGGSLSDALESTRAAASMVKGALGAAGIIFIIILCIVPLLKVGSIIIIYRISSALAEPLSENISVALSDIADTLSLIFAMVTTVSVLTIISMSALLVTGG